MADKRISFSGIDAGASTMIDKLRQKSKELGSNLIEDARKYSTVAKEQLSFIEEQIRATEKLNRLNREAAELSTRNKLGQGTPEYKSAMSSIQKEYGGEDLQVKLLRELIDTIKLTSKEEIAEDRKTVESKISDFKKSPGQFSEEEKLKLSYQESLLKGDTKEKSKGIFGEVFSGTFLANALQRSISSASQIVSAREEDQATNSLLSAIPVLGELLGGASERARQEQLAYGQARGRFRGSTFRSIGTLGRFNQYGLTGAEAQDLLSPAIQSAGRNINQTGFVASTKFADTGTLNEMLKAGRMSGEQDVSQLLRRQIGIMDRQGVDRSLLNEVLKTQLSFTNQMQSINPNFSSTNAQNIFGQFNVGGVFSAKNPNFGNYINTIQQSLSNPGNDIMQAENIRILRQLNPDADEFDIMAMQEDALGTEGFAQARIKDSVERYGLGTSGKFALESILKLPKNVIKSMVEDGSIQKIISGEANVKDIIGTFDVEKEAKKTVDRLDASAAQSSDAFVSGGAFGGAVNQFEKVIDKFDNSLDKFFGIDKNTKSQSTASMLADTGVVNPLMAKLAAAILAAFSTNAPE